MSDSTFWIPFVASVAGGIIGGVIGSGLIGTWRQHKLTERREKAAAMEERKSKFTAFMAQFRSEVTTQPRLQWEFSKYYLSKIPDLEREASMIRADFSESQRGKFNELIAKAKLTGAQADKGETPGGREEIAGILDAIAKFAENQYSKLLKNAHS
jgi:hypothetical protein